MLLKLTGRNVKYVYPTIRVRGRTQKVKILLYASRMFTFYKYRLYFEWLEINVIII